MSIPNFVFNWWIYSLIAFIFLYFSWALLTQVGIKLNAKDSTYGFATYKIFDKWLISFIFALFIARIAFILQRLSEVSKVGFFILPYTKIQGTIHFLSYYPWRVLRFNEGIDYILLLVAWVVILVLSFKNMATKIITLESSNEKLKHSLLTKWFWGVVFLILASIFSVISLYIYAH